MINGCPTKNVDSSKEKPIIPELMSACECLNEDNRWTRNGLYRLGYPNYSEKSIDKAISDLYHLGTYDDTQRKKIFARAVKYELDLSLEEPKEENANELEKSVLINEKKGPFSPAIKNTLDKTINILYKPSKFVFDCAFFIPTALRKMWNVAEKFGSGEIFMIELMAATGISVFQFNHLANTFDKSYLGIIPLATNIASGIYEIYRNEKNKSEEPNQLN